MNDEHDHDHDHATSDATSDATSESTSDATGESAVGIAAADRDEARRAELQASMADAPTIPLSEFRRRSRRSFLTGAAGAGAAFLGWRWVQDSPSDDGIPRPLRQALEFNESLWSDLTELTGNRSAPEHPISKATPIQVNGRIGIRNEIDLDDWFVRVEGPDGEVLDELDLSVFEALPQRDMVIEHKCIEGWSSIVHWGGAKFSDFHARYADRVGDVPYVGFETPDGLYYVGWDMPSALHPQTMLALRQGTEPLTQVHGAPLRLATPNKYGIKTLKRIGVIRYSRERPADYWAERSYDWYAGL
ncbi:MAG: molybdopterin-dependent oxidoreductase [Ilumatobacter sp.]|uniref:molybdopterin-dependent oxidoreductase n=1 Tax=Ilumatobacter sp. TaxID=1967498 RepID=UPI003918F1ED